MAVTTVAVGGEEDMSPVPAAIRVEHGTTVRWEWTGGGSTHNVVAADDAFEREYHTETGATFERTFVDPGVVTYRCIPHEAAGMKGFVEVI